MYTRFEEEPFRAVSDSEFWAISLSEPLITLSAATAYRPPKAGGHRTSLMQLQAAHEAAGDSAVAEPLPIIVYPRPEYDEPGYTRLVVVRRESRAGLSFRERDSLLEERQPLSPADFDERVRELLATPESDGSFWTSVYQAAGELTMVHCGTELAIAPSHNPSWGLCYDAVGLLALGPNEIMAPSAWRNTPPNNPQLRQFTPGRLAIVDRIVAAHKFAPAQPE